jgi:hypothetical protein
VDRQQLKLCAYLSLGLCWDEYLMRTSSFYRRVPTRERGTVEGSGVQSEANEGIRCMDGIPQKKMERLSSEADMRRIVFMGNN